MMKFPPMAGLKAFYAAAQAGQFKIAAANLGLTESAVSHHIRRFEQYLGLKLFEREGRNRVLTPEATRFFAEIRGPMSEILAATTSLRTPGQRSRVALTLPTSLANFWLIPNLPRFEAEFSGIDLHVIATNRICDLRGEQIDLGIRYGAGHWPNIKSRYILSENCFPVASPAYVAKMNIISPTDLTASVRILKNALHQEEWSDWCGARGFKLPSDCSHMTFGSIELVLQAAIEGLGIAMGRRPLVDRMLARGELVAPFGIDEHEPTAYYLVWPSAFQMRAPASVVRRWLISICSADATRTPRVRSSVSD